jgi:tetrahydromethanopterin S-methyltransferase subunit F
MSTGIAIFNISEMKDVIIEALKEHDEDKKKNATIESYSIHYAAKLLGRSDRTVVGLVRKGIIKATKDNRILSTELENYINNSQEDHE